MENFERMKGFGGLIAMTQSRKGTAFLAVVIVLLIGNISFDLDTEVTITIATLAFGYITGQSYVDSKEIVIEVGDVIDNLVPLADSPSDPAHGDGQNTSA